MIHTPTELGKEGKPTHAEAWKVMEELQAKGLCKSSQCLFLLPSVPGHKC